MHRKIQRSIETLFNGMNSLLEILNKTRDFFRLKGIGQPRLEAELIFAHVLACKRLELYLQFERPLTEAELDRLRRLVARRGRREPLQYILGNTEFFGLCLQSDARGLIPRPETEELVELLGGLNGTKPASILDLGTGSGAIALALAKVFPAASITAADRSPEALQLADGNARGNGLEGRVQWILSDWFSDISRNARFDWIVSNPPYLSEDEWLQAEPEVREHEPRQALVSANSGIHDLLEIMHAALPVLNAGGLLALETGIGHHAKLRQTAEALGYADCRSINDLSGRPRFFLARKPEAAD